MVVLHVGRDSGILIIEDDRAELGTGAMIIFIAIVIAAAVVGSVIVAATGMMFSSQSNDAQATTEPFGGIVNVIRLEVAALGATDEIEVVFDLPYTATAVPEEELSWTVMCAHDGDTSIQFDQGAFQGATTLDGDGKTDLPLTEFDPGVTYHIRLELDACDLETLDSISIVFLVENGRTVEKFANLIDGVTVGKDLM